jgi:hypothetical protein
MQAVQVLAWHAAHVNAALTQLQQSRQALEGLHSCGYMRCICARQVSGFARRLPPCTITIAAMRALALLEPLGLMLDHPGEHLGHGLAAPRSCIAERHHAVHELR